MSLEFDATVAARDVSAAFQVGAGETVAVLGPNGAGKSTLLEVLAGLVRPDSGRATLDGDVLFDLAGPGRPRWSPPHARGVSLLAQDALLFPHLTALGNVAFGPRSRGIGRRDAERSAHEWLDRVGASELSGRRPGALSGGQAQRIAVARALASDPALLLLDEPMAALDVAVAPALRRLLRDVLADRTAIIVTHDVLDAYMLADRVLVVEAGRVVDSGLPREVLERPRTPFAARLAGLNLLVGRMTAEGFALGDSAEATSVLTDPRLRDVAARGARAALAVRPADVDIERMSVSGGDDRGFVSLSGAVLDLEPRGDLVRVRGASISADLTPRRVADLDLAPGIIVHFVFRSDDAVIYPLD